MLGAVFGVADKCTTSWPLWLALVMIALGPALHLGRRALARSPFFARQFEADGCRSALNQLFLGYVAPVLFVGIGLWALVDRLQHPGCP